MPISRTETVRLTCPSRGHEFEARVWRLVDSTERPDLAERAREGQLNLVTCPECDWQGHWDGHLLYHDRELERLLLAVPLETTAEEDEESARHLLGELLAALPPRCCGHASPPPRPAPKGAPTSGWLWSAWPWPWGRLWTRTWPIGWPNGRTCPLA